MDLPFECSDVEALEMFHFSNPTEAEKKVITEPEDIKSIYELLKHTSMEDKAAEPVAGGSVTSFCFRLSDDTVYAVIYCKTAAKTGRIKTTGMEKDYFTSDDIEASWDYYDYEVMAVSEKELPLWE